MFVMITCFYADRTKRRLKDKISEHKNAIRKANLDLYLDIYDHLVEFFVCFFFHSFVCEHSQPAI